MFTKENSLEHTWKYFELHSKQRMTVFNFYLTLSSFIAAGIGLSLQKGASYYYISSCLSFFMLFITIIFYKLDQRVSQLIKKSELAFTDLENEMLKEEFRLFSNDRANNEINKGLFRVWSYGRCLRASFLFVGIMSILIIPLPFTADKLMLTVHEIESKITPKNPKKIEEKYDVISKDK